MNLLEPRFDDFEKIHDFFSSNNDFHFHLETVQVNLVVLQEVVVCGTFQKVRIWTEKSLKKCRSKKKTKKGFEDFPKNIEIVIGKLDHCAYAGIYERDSEYVNDRPGKSQGQDETRTVIMFSICADEYCQFGDRC